MRIPTLEWRLIAETRGAYEVSERGDVRRVDTDKLRACAVDVGGYRKAKLYVDGRELSRWVHRLVAIAFLGDPPFPKAVVRHLDGNADHNWAENLAWGTASDNEYDKVRHGRHHNAIKTHCKHGHEFSPANTYRQPNGGRGCRECRRISTRERMRTARACGKSYAR